MVGVAGKQDEGNGCGVVGDGVNDVRKLSRGRDQDGVTGLSNVSHEGVVCCVNPPGGVLEFGQFVCLEVGTHGTTADRLR
jgi:hypothetical protein